MKARDLSFNEWVVGAAIVVIGAIVVAATVGTLLQWFLWSWRF